ncbi:MAG: hypothetical protein ACRDGL_11680, partial [Candidatus Limnocylindrales bacterium]
MSSDATAPNVSAGAPGIATAPAAPARKPGNPRIGYAFAALNAVVSGVAIYVNSQGVKTFSDSTLYT